MLVRGTVIRFATLFLLLTLSQACAAEPAFVVIADPETPSRHLTRQTLARIFLRKQIFWQGGQAIQPVNLPPTNSLRREFSLQVLGVAPDSLEDYWRDMYFNGVLPPHVFASEEAVALFVSSTPGAIGYLSSCLPGHRYVVVMLVGDVAGCPK
jgi:ABC-type phosphate transport system substrate-binding protein